MGKKVGPYGAFTGLRFEDDDEEPAQVILGRWDILGASHHVWFIRVHGGEGIEGESECQEAVCDPYGRFASMGDAVSQSAPFETVELPDVPGRWVMFIHPYET